jgi:hypothetical protein
MPKTAQHHHQESDCDEMCCETVETTDHAANVWRDLAVDMGRQMGPSAATRA